MEFKLFKETIFFQLELCVDCGSLNQMIFVKNYIILERFVG
jgi:hypothetical protein